MHEALTSGHLGKWKTGECLLCQFYWYKISEDADLWVQRYGKCAMVKKPLKMPQAPMGEMLVGAPLDRIGIDILEALPLTPRGNRYILGVTDYFTKWVEIFAIPDFTAATCAHVLVEEVFM